MAEQIKNLLSKEFDKAKYPPIKNFNTALFKALYVLGVAKLEFSVNGLTASEIAEIGNRKFGVKITRQAVEIALKSSEYVDVKWEDKSKKYTIQEEGLQALGFFAPKIKKFSKFVVPPELVENSKGYIKQTTYQINGCYSDSYYDACYTMVRKLIETLIIEVYEKLGIEEEIKDSNKNYFMLRDLIPKCLNQSKIKLGRVTKDVLHKIKLYGGTAAHNPRINLKQADIDKYADNIRIAVQDFLANLEN